MTEALTADKDAFPAEGFQALDTGDLSDMVPSPGIDRPDGGAGGPPGGEEVPVAVPDAPAESRTAEAPSVPVEVSGIEGAASSENLSGQALGDPADAPGAASMLKEVPADEPAQATRVLAAMRPVLKIAFCIGAVLCVASGIWLLMRQPQADPAAGRSRAAQELTIPAEELRPARPEPGPPAADDHFAWEAKLREVDALRHTLLAKKEEILKLQQNYQDGVLEVEEEAARLIKRTGIDTPAQALKHRQLDLALKSIQRRQAYRDGLEKPLRWIELGSEELLYLKRRAIIDLQLKEIAEHIDFKSNRLQIDSAISKYQPTAERLAVGTPAQVNASLDGVWKRLTEQARLATVSPGDQQDQEIINEVCSGHLGRLSELTNLTLRAARCLAESGAMELFMNRLSRISPAAAKKLGEWPGQWLCLNGLTRLPPDVARHLSGWTGERISLNGLSELPVEAAAALAGWKGRQLELMGLRTAGGLEPLAQWEAAGGKLYVPDGIRKAIGQIGAKGRPPANTPGSGRF
ncbi:MAG: hypothetical protein MUC33_06595 [Desulfobacterales bacterium]|nr:hypothetical protein [Desulfobacterales bacterium]